MLALSPQRYGGHSGQHYIISTAFFDCSIRSNKGLVVWNIDGRCRAGKKIIWRVGMLAWWEVGGKPTAITVTNGDRVRCSLGGDLLPPRHARRQ